MAKSRDLEIFLKVEIERLKARNVLSREELRELSIRQWAYGKIIEKIHQNPEGNLIDMLEKFIKQMDDYICACVNSDDSETWIIVHDTAEWVLDTALATVL